MKNWSLLSSFLGFMDIKLGASVITLFAVLNKVAGAYGMLAIFNGGTFAQISMYLYSIATIVVFLWGLKGIGEENSAVALPYAHLFALDHFISTAYTVLFAVIWWVLTPHDGRRIANSEAQKEMQGVGAGPYDPNERKALAEGVWAGEREFAAAVLVFGWFLKIYFILILYSFALHLRRGSYRTLPRSRPVPLSVPITNATPAAAMAASDTPNGGRWASAFFPSPTAGTGGRPYAYSHVRTQSTASGSGTRRSGEEVDEDSLSRRRGSVPST